MCQMKSCNNLRLKVISKILVSILFQVSLTHFRQCGRVWYAIEEGTVMFELLSLHTAGVENLVFKAVSWNPFFPNNKRTAQHFIIRRVCCHITDVSNKEKESYLKNGLIKKLSGLSQEVIIWFVKMQINKPRALWPTPLVFFYSSVQSPLLFCFFFFF